MITYTSFNAEVGVGDKVHPVSFTGSVLTVEGLTPAQAQLLVSLLPEFLTGVQSKAPPSTGGVGLTPQEHAEADARVTKALTSFNNGRSSEEHTQKDHAYPLDPETLANRRQAEFYAKRSERLMETLARVEVLEKANPEPFIPLNRPLEVENLPPIAALRPETFEEALAAHEKANPEPPKPAPQASPPVTPTPQRRFVPGVLSPDNGGIVRPSEDAEPTHAVCQGCQVEHPMEEMGFESTPPWRITCVNCRTAALAPKPICQGCGDTFRNAESLGKHVCPVAAPAAVVTREATPPPPAPPSPFEVLLGRIQGDGFATHNEVEGKKLRREIEAFAALPGCQQTEVVKLQEELTLRSSAYTPVKRQPRAYTPVPPLNLEVQNVAATSPIEASPATAQVMNTLAAEVIVRCPDCGKQLDGENSSVLRSGKRKHVGCEYANGTNDLDSQIVQASTVREAVTLLHRAGIKTLGEILPRLEGLRTRSDTLKKVVSLKERIETALTLLE